LTLSVNYAMRNEIEKVISRVMTNLRGAVGFVLRAVLRVARAIDRTRWDPKV